MEPVVLPANLPDTFYRGAGRLAAFRGADLPPRPEDWVGSTTARFQQAPVGQSVLPDGRLLADVIHTDPEAWLGAEHVERFGPDPAVLVKLLDPGQRLPVHVHPSRDFARSHLASPYGKNEAWVIVDAAPDAEVYLGFARDVAAEQLRRWVADQDVAALLGATNRVPVTAGDALFCPAGTPHAIGPDILLVEVQEPTDFSVLLEREGFDVPADDALLGLPMDLALACVARGACPPETLRGQAAGSLLPAAADEFFRAERVTAGEAVRGFAILVVVSGTGALEGDWGRTPIGRGATLVLPHGAGSARLTGSLELVRCGPAR